MANYAALKAAIEAVIYENGNQEITGSVLQATLLAMVNSLGANYQCAGIATPSTNPGTPDQNVAYIAGPGVYPNFDNATVPNGCLGLFVYNGEWAISIFRINEDYTSFFSLYQPNLINPSFVVVGYIGNTGQDSDLTTYYRTDNYIPVSPNTSYKLLESTTTSHIFRRVAFYDGNGDFISSTDNVSSFTTPNNAAYVRVAWTLSYGTGLGLFLSTTTTYVPFIQAVLLNEMGTIDDFPDNAIVRKKDLSGIYSQLQAHQNAIDGIDDITDLFDKEISDNLIDPGQVVDGYLGTNGQDYVLANYYRTDNYIPIIGGQSYKMLRPSTTTGVLRRISFYDSNKSFISNVDSTATFTTPSNAAFVRCAWLSSMGKDVGLFTSSVSQYGSYWDVLTLKQNGNYKDFPEDSILRKKDLSQNLIPIEARVSDIENDIYGSGSMVVSKNGVIITIGRNNDTIVISLNKNPDDYFGGNPVCNFIGWNYNNESNDYNRDNVAPTHILNTTLGANHGYPIRKATITNHGLNNAAVGSSWTQDGNTFYLVRVVDANNLWFVGQNTGTQANPTRPQLDSGNIQYNNNTYSISSVSSVQLYPSVNNVQQTILLDGQREISDDGNYNCQYIDIVEEYDLMDLDDIITKLISRLGNTQPPIYDGNALVHIRNIYRIIANDDNFTCIIMETILPQNTISFQNYMFAQDAFLADMTNVLWYLPNSKPSIQNFVLPSSWDLQTSIFVNNSYWADEDNPVNRVIAIGGNVCFCIGYINGLGVGKELKNLTLNTFELRGGGSGKIYPHGVERGKIGDSVGITDIYTGVLFKTYSKKEVGNRIAFFHFPINGEEYVFVDYRNSCIDHIIIGPEFNGKEITIIESSNAILSSNVYNNGIDIVANYVSGQTCYMVLKIKE